MGKLKFEVSAQLIEEEKGYENLERRSIKRIKSASYKKLISLRIKIRSWWSTTYTLWKEISLKVVWWNGQDHYVVHHSWRMEKGGISIPLCIIKS